MAEVIGNIFENPKLLKYALDDDERAARLEAFSERLEARCDPANEDWNYWNSIVKCGAKLNLEY